MNSKIKAGCGVIFVFALGVFAGFILTIALVGSVVKKSETWKTRESKNFVANHLAKQLNLNDDQRQKFQPIVDGFLEERWELRKKYLQNDQQLITEKYLPRVTGFLTDEQKTKAQELLDRWEKDHAEKLNREAASMKE